MLGGTDDPLATFSGAEEMDFEEEFREKNIVEKMMQLWLKEEAVPEILPFDYDLCETVTEKLEEKQNTLYAEKKRDLKKGEIMELECERVKFLLKAYLRARLEKINRYTRYIASDKEQQSRLSVPEKEYSINLASIIEGHFFKTTLERLGPELHKMDNVAIHEKPDLSKPVFVRVIKDIGSLLINGEQELQLVKNCIYCIQYQHIAHLINETDAIEFV